MIVNGNINTTQGFVFCNLQTIYDRFMQPFNKPRFPSYLMQLDSYGT